MRFTNHDDGGITDMAGDYYLSAGHKKWLNFRLTILKTNSMKKTLHPFPADILTGVDLMINSAKIKRPSGHVNSADDEIDIVQNMTKRYPI